MRKECFWAFRAALFAVQKIQKNAPRIRGDFLCPLKIFFRGDFYDRAKGGAPRRGRTGEGDVSRPRAGNVSRRGAGCADGAGFADCAKRHGGGAGNAACPGLHKAAAAGGGDCADGADGAFRSGQRAIGTAFRGGRDGFSRCRSAARRADQLRGAGRHAARGAERARRGAPCKGRARADPRRTARDRGGALRKGARRAQTGQGVFHGVAHRKARPSDGARVRRDLSGISHLSRGALFAARLFQCVRAFGRLFVRPARVGHRQSAQRVPEPARFGHGRHRRTCEFSHQLRILYRADPRVQVQEGAEMGHPHARRWRSITDRRGAFGQPLYQLPAVHGRGRGGVFCGAVVVHHPL